VWRVPEDWFGRNYPIDRTSSVVEHYIDNDRQLTHVNSAWPWRGGLLVSLLIPGAIGWSDPDGIYHELMRGFVGCHGARVRSDIEEIFFADSCSGMLVFLDLKGQVIRRVGTGSRWLHDAVQIRDELFAAATFDRNEVVLLNVATRQVAGRISCAARGGPRSLSFAAAAAATRESGLRPDVRADDIGRTVPDMEMDRAELSRRHAAMIRARDELAHDYLARLRARDAAIADLREERNVAVATRDAIVAELHTSSAREIALRDGLLAELEATRSHEVALRDAIIAGLHAQQAHEVGVRDAMLADLAAARQQDVAIRDAIIADLHVQQAREMAVRDATIAAMCKQQDRAPESDQAMIKIPATFAAGG
jgi:hypothetical protein